jgi:histidinol-phosphate aminotransferase
MANFVLARFADAAEAEGCDAYLRSQGLLVRQVAGYKLPHCLRITVGTGEECTLVADTLSAFMHDL